MDAWGPVTLHLAIRLCCSLRSSDIYLSISTPTFLAAKPDSLHSCILWWPIQVVYLVEADVLCGTISMYATLSVPPIIFVFFPSNVTPGRIRNAHPRTDARAHSGSRSQSWLALTAEFRNTGLNTSNECQRVLVRSGDCKFKLNYMMRPSPPRCVPH